MRAAAALAAVLNRRELLRTGGGLQEQTRNSRRKLGLTERLRQAGQVRSNTFGFREA